jgi:LysM repeat protein
MPQGSLDEQRPRNKSNVYIAVFAILAFHVVLLGALLLQGCKGNPPGGTLTGGTQEPGIFAPTNSVPELATTGNSSNPFDPPSISGLANPLPPPGSNHAPVAPPPPIVVPEPINPAPLAGVREHEVAAGDSFTTIAKKYGVSAAAIAKANPGVNSSKLKIKQKLKIPEAAAVAAAPAPAVAGGAPAAAGGAPEAPAAPANTVSYKVKKGDSLTKIAKLHGTKVETLKAANNLKTTMIREGQTLKVPGKAEAIPAAPAAPALPPTSTGYITPLPGRTTAAL